MHPKSLHIPRLAHDNKGAAIVIVLAFLVMITFVVVAFFSRATANRQIENSSVGGKKAALLARSAGDLIVADLRKEMLLLSSTGGTTSWPVLTPTNSQSMVPTRLLMSGLAADSNFLNLVKQSGIASTGGLLPAGTVSTTTASLDGHKISGDRWSAPKLTGGPAGPVNFSDTQVPNWTLVTRSGVPVGQTWNPSFKSAMTSNTNYVIGRFAFNVYDEGGLLDVNVAGFPTSVVSGSDVSLKGTQGLVDLGLIPGVINADTFVKSWRNMATGQNSADYLAYLGVGGSGNSSSGVVFGSGPRNGFLKSGTTASATDNRLLSRQDLIRLAANGTLGISGTALPFLTTFSRSLNAPTYTPDPGRPKVTDPQMATKGFDDAFNPGLLSSTCRVTGTFTRPDGTVAQIGEPLLKHRFPLSRIGGIGYNGIVTTGNTTMLNGMPSPASATTILRDFGLTWNNGVWTYNHGVGNRIYKLSEVATLNPPREPDFFELLQASISVGSLGKGWRWYDQNAYYQILQIGANLLNQAAPDSYPRRISFNNGTVEIDGVANLPYLSRVITKFDRDQPVVPSNDPQWIGAAPGPALVGPLGLWFQAEIWNPHQNANTPSNNGPTEFRFYATGSVMYWAGYNVITDISTTPWTATQGNVYSKVYTFPTTGSGIQFGLSKVPDRFATPTLLTPSNITSATDPHDNTTDIGDPTQSIPGAAFVGLYTPDTETIIAINDPNEFYWLQHPTNPGAGGATGASSDSSHQPLTFLLQYKDPGGNWITYTSITNTRNQMGGNGGIRRIGTVQGQIYKADPRSLRLGYCPIWTDGSPPTTVGTGNTLHSDYSKPGWPGSSYNWGYTSIGDDTGLQGTPVSSYPGFIGNYYGYFAENITIDRGSTEGNPAWGYTVVGPNYYADPDGAIRPGNANRAYGSKADGEELQIPAASNTSRPTMLDRPFRSVAEMGYAFRDDPWRNIDFFSAKSADAALLDTFCIDEQAGSALTAGVLNLNTRQQPVLSAVVNGALKDAALVSSTLSATDTASLASIIATTTAASPMMNRSELATKIAPALTYSSATDGAIKARRESAIRALADAGDTRTWNLLIDVIAQSGRFPVTANGVDQFIVEGETRYWLHVAIDRFTGQVIDQNLEVVNE